MGNRHNYSKHYDQENPEKIESSEFEEVKEFKEEEVITSMGEVLVEKLNIRSNPSSENNDNIVKELVKGDVVEILQDVDEWYHICTATGIDGYVMSKYVKVIL